MKKIVYTLILAVIIMAGANASFAEDNEHATKKLTKATFLEKIWDYEKSPKTWVFKGEKPVLIDFYADWCGPCRTAAPILEEVAQEYKGKIDVYKIDTEVDKELKAVFGVRGIPAFLYIPMEGKPTMTSGIARSKADTKKMFVDNIEKILLKNDVTALTDE